MTANGPEHDRLHESAGLYVLGALEPNERAEFERHLQSCDECTAEVRSLGGVVAALPHGVPLVDPPASLRSRVMAVTGRSTTIPANVVALPARPVRTRSWMSTAGWLSAAALFLVSLGLGGYSMSLQREISGLRTEVGDLNARLNQSEQRVTVATRLVALADARMAVLTAPDLTAGRSSGSAAGRAACVRSRVLQSLARARVHGVRPAAASRRPNVSAVGRHRAVTRQRRAAGARHRRPRDASVQHAARSGGAGRDRRHRRTRGRRRRADR